jgi:hypothetical protein
MSEPVAGERAQRVVWKERTIKIAEWGESSATDPFPSKGKDRMRLGFTPALSLKERGKIPSRGDTGYADKKRPALARRPIALQWRGVAPSPKGKA